jgi:hypothetical protein
LLLIACDVAVQEKDSLAIEVLLFMQKLLASKWYLIILNSRPAQCRTDAKGHRFSDVFAKSKMYFNHFIKVHNFKVINQDFLRLLIARGAAVLCTNHQAGIDVLLPLLYFDNNLQQDNISGIFIQVKNDRSFSSTRF